MKGNSLLLYKNIGKLVKKKRTKPPQRNKEEPPTPLSLHYWVSISVFYHYSCNNSLALFSFEFCAFWSVTLANSLMFPPESWQLWRGRYQLHVSNGNTWTGVVLVRYNHGQHWGIPGDLTAAFLDPPRARIYSGSSLWPGVHGLYQLPLGWHLISSGSFDLQQVTPSLCAAGSME